MSSRRTLALLGAGLVLTLGCRSNDCRAAPAAPNETADAAAKSPPARESESTAPPLPEPTNADPVVVAASLDPARITPGGTSVLSLRVKVAASWHIYARGESSGANAPTALGIELPAGLEWAGDWSDPPTRSDPTASGPVHEGTFEFRRTLRATKDARPARYEFPGTMTYQACDPMLCRPPARLDWKTTLVVVAATGAFLQAPARDTPIDLAVVYVGAAEGATGKAAAGAARTRDYLEFLRSRFIDARAVDRDHFDPAGVADADVVLLDWSQSDIDLQQLQHLPSPIGPREKWDKPLVLLGSAGLLLGVPWQLKGGFG
jgi:hypothetical protein